jgi:transcriptional regulator with PAS, ATPase and Fis domain
MKKPIYKGDLKKFIKATERYYIENALALHNNNRAATARAMNLNRTTLIEKMKSLDIFDKHPTPHQECVSKKYSDNE